MNAGTPPVSIVVLGSATGDLIVRQRRLAEVGETIFGTDFTTVPGGKGLNQAVAAARAGGAVRFLGAVGDDEYGRAARSVLNEAGADTSGLAVVDAPTGTAHISVLDGGDNSIVIVPAANAAVSSLDDDAKATIDAAGFIVAQFERPLPLIGEAFTRARERGIQTVLTPAPVTPGGTDLLDLVDILVPNEREAQELSGEEDPYQAARSLSARAGLVILTRGERGGIVARGGEIISEFRAHVVDAIDTTGAGDTFVGVLVAWLSHGAPLPRAIDAAAVAAAVSVTRRGASSSVPERREILHFLDSARG